jgi:hypothetical protein
MPRWLIDRAGVKLTIKTKSKKAEALINVAFDAMATERVQKTRGIKLSVKRDAGQWVLHDHASNLRRKLKLPGDLIYHLTDRIVFHLADKAQGVHCLHAASVSKNGRALVIPANSGAGKSSFTTWLSANGFDYLTDELILIDSERKIQGLARPIQIKPHGIDAVQGLIIDNDKVQPGRFANAVPISSLGGSVSELSHHQLSLFVFPQYKKGADFEFQKLSAADAGMKLMANHVNARNLEGHGFREMMDIIRNTPCYSLEYGGFDRLPADFAQQIESLLAV